MAGIYTPPRTYRIAVRLDPLNSAKFYAEITTVSQTTDGKDYFISQVYDEIGTLAPFQATVEAAHASDLENRDYEVLT